MFPAAGISALSNCRMVFSPMSRRALFRRGLEGETIGGSPGREGVRIKPSLDLVAIE